MERERYVRLVEFVQGLDGAGPRILAIDQQAGGSTEQSLHMMLAYTISKSIGLGALVIAEAISGLRKEG